MTLVAALTPTGLQAAMTGSGAVNGAVFAAYLSQVMGPTLEPGDVVVLDNLSAHKVDGLTGLVEARGVRLLYLPPYSPGGQLVFQIFCALAEHERNVLVPRTRAGLQAARARGRQRGSPGPGPALPENRAHRQGTLRGRPAVHPPTHGLFPDWFPPYPL